VVENTEISRLKRDLRFLWFFNWYVGTHFNCEKIEILIATIIDIYRHRCYNQRKIHLKRKMHLKRGVKEKLRKERHAGKSNNRGKYALIDGFRQ